jgi:hypothetical protein
MMLSVAVSLLSGNLISGAKLARDFLFNIWLRLRNPPKKAKVILHLPLLSHPVTETHSCSSLSFQQNQSPLPQKADCKLPRPANAFPQFSWLPKELQLKIWEMTTEEPRMVIIRSSSFPSGRGIWSPTPVPAALHVCAESRAIALKTYKLSFSVSSQNRPLWLLNQEEWSFPAQIYFNFARDVLYFRSGGPYKGLQHFDEFRAACLPADRQRVQAVGLDIIAKAHSYHSTLYNATPYTTVYGSEIRGSFEGLETLFVCQERARFNTKRAIQFSPLQKGQEWAFVRHYIWHLERASAFKHLSLAEALDQVKDKFLPRYEVESGQPDIRFATVTNL